MNWRNLAVISSLLVGAGLSYAYQARAGYKSSVTAVTINTASRYFYGALGAARNSADTVQYVGCSIRSTSGGSNYASCSAYSAGSVAAGCTASGSELIAQIRSITADSYIKVSYDAAGSCTEITVTNQSYLAPKDL